MDLLSFLRLCESGLETEIDRCIPMLDISAGDVRGWDVLMYVAGNTEYPWLIYRLVDAGADILRRDDDGRTALIHAAWNNPNTDIVKALLDCGSEINAQDTCGRTALIYAVERNDNPEIVKCLLLRGADSRIKNGGGLTALMISKALEKTEAMMILLQAELGLADFSGE